MVFPFLKVLLGNGRFRVLRAWWATDEGQNGFGSLSFRHFAIFFIFFLLGMFVLLLQHSLNFELFYRYSSYINIAGQKLVPRWKRAADAEGKISPLTGFKYLFLHNIKSFNYLQATWFQYLFLSLRKQSWALAREIGLLRNVAYLGKDGLFNFFC
jgi:hypothetical protein